MKSIKMFLSIFIAFSMFSNSGFADGKDKLETSINEFKIAFTDRLYGSLSWGMQHDADSMLHITDEIVSEHGIRGELIPFVSTLGEEYAAKGDVLSLLILATLCFHYVPNESRELILRYVMILQSAIFHAMKTTDKKELIFEQIKELFESMKPEKQSVFFEESRTVFSSISQGHYTGKLFTNQSGAYLLTFFPTPLLLIDALISTWTIKRGVSR
ncbi:hypothetical protein [Endozoicomonas sp. 8E]|uniref:hypothetical protein n=1 Tax=Endozoicomonas sp. 8E TaxID=3035692 RepID=UPI00293931DC|nr:hypothetical protein [Endozoicomonas sp. 8E]WOG29784.1 hypothetical protein P6910_09040 [Endozoicomonas sp. 8E]